MQKQTGKTPLALQGPEFPDLLGHIWLDFLELRRTKKSTELGPEPIDYKDLEAWSNMTGATPTPRDIELILRLDGAYREVVNG